MRQVLILSFILLFSTSHLWAGWKIIIQENEDGYQEVVNYFIDKDVIKISNRSMDFIYDKSEKRIVIINHEIKSFFMGNFDEYNNQLNDLYDIKENKTDAVLPKSYIQHFDELLSRNISNYQNDNIRTNPSIKINPVRGNERIAEYNANEFQILFDTSLIEKIWFSQDIQITEVDILEAYRFFRGISSEGLSHAKFINTQEYEQLSYNGFPMKIRNYDNYGMEVYSYEVVLVQEMEFDTEEIFSPPSNYESRTLIDIIMAKE